MRSKLRFERREALALEREEMTSDQVKQTCGSPGRNVHRINGTYRRLDKVHLKRYIRIKRVRWKCILTLLQRLMQAEPRIDPSGGT